MINKMRDKNWVQNICLMTVLFKINLGGKLFLFRLLFPLDMDHSCGMMECLIVSELSLGITDSALDVDKKCN